MNELEQTLQAGERIHEFLQQAPEVLEFLRLLKETGADQLLVPVRADKLISVGQAAEILKVSKNTIGEYYRRGLLPAYTTLDSGIRKFWMRDVLALAHREVV